MPQRLRPEDIRMPVDECGAEPLVDDQTGQQHQAPHGPQDVPRALLLEWPTGRRLLDLRHSWLRKHLNVVGDHDRRGRQVYRLVLGIVYDLDRRCFRLLLPKFALSHDGSRRTNGDSCPALLAVLAVQQFVRGKTRARSRRPAALFLPAPGQEFVETDVDLLDRKAAGRRIEQKGPRCGAIRRKCLPAFPGPPRWPGVAAIRRDETKPGQRLLGLCRLGTRIGCVLIST